MPLQNAKDLYSEQYPSWKFSFSRFPQVYQTGKKKKKDLYYW